MSSTPKPPQKPRVSPTLIGGGILVVALGFGLPMLTSGPKLGGKPEAPRESAPQTQPTSPTPKTPAPMDAPSTAGLGAALLRMVVVLVVVCGACVLVARWVGPKPAPASGTMETLASIRVAHCVVHLVRAGDRRLLVGTDFAGVKSVLELPGPEPEIPPTPSATDSAPAAPMDEPPPAPPPSAAAEDSVTPDQLVNLLLRLRDRASASPPA